MTLEIRCPRTQCPPLNCSEKIAYRPDKKACCKVCPQVRHFTTAKTLQTYIKTQILLVVPD